MNSLNMILIRKTQGWLLSRGPGHGERFAADIRDAYESSVPEEHRNLRWSESKVASTRLNSDYQRVKRYLTLDQHLPAELVTPWLRVLPEDLRDEVLAEFNECFGKQIVDVAQACDAPDVTLFANLARESGEAMAALAPLLEDGQITSDDDVQAIRHALIQMGELSAAIEAMRAKLVAALPKADVRPIKRKAS